MSLMDNLTGGNGLLGEVNKRVESMRPHILGEVAPSKALSSGGLFGGTGGILSAPMANLQGRLKGIQAAPTIRDKITSILPIMGKLGGTPSNTSPPATSSEFYGEQTYIPPLAPESPTPGIKFG